MSKIIIAITAIAIALSTCTTVRAQTLEQMINSAAALVLIKTQCDYKWNPKQEAWVAAVRNAIGIDALTLRALGGALDLENYKYGKAGGCRMLSEKADLIR